MMPGMGCPDITVWDDDTLAEHNIPSQMCLGNEIGNPKVEALRTLAQCLAGVRIQTKRARYAGPFLAGVVIAATNTMEARQEVWKRAKMNPKIPLLIAARMGAEFARIYSQRQPPPLFCKQQGLSTQLVGAGRFEL